MGAISTEPVWCSACPSLGSAVNDRQSVDGEVDLHDAAARPPALDVAHEVVGQVSRADVLEEGALGVQAGDHGRRPQLLTRLEDSALDPAVRHEQRSDWRAGPDLGPEGLGAAPDGGRDRPHPALRVAPAAELTVADPADRVVRHDVGGARLVGPGPGADDAVDRHRALHLRRLEPLVEQVRDAHRHQPRQVGDGAGVDATVAPHQSGQVGDVARRVGTDGGRHRHQEGPEHVGEPAQPLVPLLPCPGVLRRPLLDLLAGADRVVVVDRERPALGEGLVVGTHRVDLVPVPLQLQVREDRRGHQAHHVGQPGDRQLRVLRPGPLGGRRPADRGPGLQDDRPQA